MSSAPRRPRRAVRPAGTVGTDESVLRSVHPATGDPASAPDGPAVPASPPSTSLSPSTTGTGSGARSVPSTSARTNGTSDGDAALVDRAAARRPGAQPDDLWRTSRSADDSDQGWGRSEPSSNDDRLLREKPPHW